MANQKQEVELLIKAGTEGLKSIGQLVKELEALGEDTGEASEKLEGLAGSLKGLRDQQKLVKQFADLKLETRGLAQQQEDAKAKATALGKALAQTEKPTRAQRVEFEKARKASKDADQAWESNQAELNRLRTSLSDAGISTSNLSDEQRRIKREIAGVDDEISNVTGELTQMRDSARDAAKGSRELGDDVEKSAGRVSTFRERLQGLNPVLGKIGSGLKAAGVAIAGFVAAAGASVATLSVFSKGQARLADELTNTSNAIGINREQLQLWRIAGDRVGLSGEKVSDILRSVSERLGEFSRTGGGEAAQVLETLNLKIRDLRDLSPDEQMRRLANAIGEIGSKSEQVALLEKLASDASQLQPLLEDNAAGLQAIFDEAQKDGAIYTGQELDKLNKANDIYNSIDLKLKALTTRIGAQLAPAVGQATERVLELFNSSGAGDALVDIFTRLSNAAVGFLERLDSNATSIGETFSGLTKTIGFFGNGALAVFRGVQAVVSGFLTITVTGISNALSAAEGLAFVLNKVGVVSDSAYNTVAAKAEAARASVVDLAKQTVEYGKQSADAAAAAIKAFEDTGAAAKKTEEETEKAGVTLQEIPPKIKSAAEEAEDALKRQQEETRRARDELSDFGIDGARALTGISTEAQTTIDSIGDMAETIRKAGLEGKAAATAFEEGFEEAISKINSKEGLLALQEEIEELEKSGKIGGEGAAKGLELIRTKLLEIRGVNDDLGDELQESMDSTGESAADAAEEVNSLADAMHNSSDEAREFKEKFRDAWGGAFGEALTNARESVTALSNAARNLFETRINSNQFVQGAVDIEEALKKTNEEVYKLSQASQRLMSNSFADWFNNIALQAARTRQEFYQQAIQLEGLIDRINDGAFSMEQLARMSDTAANRFDLLDSQQLTGLQGAIDAARNKLESLNSSAESTLNSLRQRLADIRGDTEEAQRLQYEAERRRLEEQLAAAREAGATEAVREYEEALRVLREINKTEQQNRKEQDNQREKEAADRQRDQERAERERQQHQREINQPRTPSSVPLPAPAQRIELTLPTGGVANLSGDPQSVNDFLEFLNQAGMRTTQ